VRGGGRSKRDQVKCVYANARASVLGALGGARGPGEDRIAPEQELAGGARGSTSSGGAPWGKPRRLGSGKAVGKAGRTRGLVQSSAGAAGVAHMAGQSGGCARQRNRGGGREVDERGPGCNFQKRQGPHCNAQIILKLELK
jgi:hypothetical protein